MKRLTDRGRRRRRAGRGGRPRSLGRADRRTRCARAARASRAGRAAPRPAAPTGCLRPSAGRASSCGSATSAASAPMTPSPTTGWSSRRCFRSPRGALVHRIEGELGAERAADAYDALLRERVPPAPAMPVLDIVVLGIGEDGHTASLFPNNPALAVTGRAAVAVHDSPKPPPDRVSLSLEVLRAARACVLLASGAGKAEPLALALAGPDPAIPVEPARAHASAGDRRRRGSGDGPVAAELLDRPPRRHRLDGSGQHTGRTDLPLNAAGRAMAAAPGAAAGRPHVRRGLVEPAARGRSRPRGSPASRRGRLEPRGMGLRRATRA